ncbi:MAG: DNA repair protein RadC [Betaproteobacteria bacterium]|nr:DNA repair protein RadC [Betaproteobacteria bacterium]MDE2124259.1 DNA repair protein RadC [Betaproteobacteria bacterium]MDE2186598.1 DNA repair protein RadC [Betaproteobacteria bacterium]MDE2326133.1 DNA repair protein RadC [Betaproteobacteria bacterium]
MATRIADLPADTRPREKLLAHGAQVLADAELVALLLRTGVRGASAIDLGADLIARFGGLHGLLHANPVQLRAIKGLGPAKYAELAAVLELARRALVERMAERAMLDSPQAVRDYLRLWLGGQDVEVFAALFLDTRHQLIRAVELSRGTLAHTSVYPREVVKQALALNAAALVIAHNHPSGVAEPSAADRHLTDHLKSALALVDVRLLDHFVVTREKVLSFAGSGLL